MLFFSCLVFPPFRHEAGISNALRMKPSAPAFGVPRGSLGAVSTIGGVGGSGSVSNDEGGVVPAPAFSIAVGSSGLLLTRVSLHGQGLRAIEGLETCRNLEILVIER